MTRKETNKLLQNGRRPSHHYEELINKNIVCEDEASAEAMRFNMSAMTGVKPCSQACKDRS